MFVYTRLATRSVRMLGLMAGRASLPHDVPLWIDPSREIFFLTICCQPRGTNHLVHPQLAPQLFDTIAHRNTHGVWHAYLFVLMPDHCHALISFPQDGPGLSTTVRRWKQWTARQLGIQWQRDFFDHRIRHDESAREKADYILENPIRAGLVKRWEDWPYIWMAEDGFLAISR